MPPDWGAATVEEMTWPEPDMAVLRLHRRPPPLLPLDVFARDWGPWIEAAAEAAACPLDYVVALLLASVSELIGHACWAQAAPGWAEPPHLWLGAVGDSGNGKSPGADCLMRDVLPEIERQMRADFPERLREWRAASVGGGAMSQWAALFAALSSTGDTVDTMRRSARLRPIVSQSVKSVTAPTPSRATTVRACSVGQLSPRGGNGTASALNFRD